MEFKTIDTKGQVTIPKKMRDELGLSEKSPVSVELKDGKIIITKLEVKPSA